MGGGGDVVGVGGVGEFSLGLQGFETPTQRCGRLLVGIGAQREPERSLGPVGGRDDCRGDLRGVTGCGQWWQFTGEHAAQLSGRTVGVLGQRRAHDGVVGAEAGAGDAGLDNGHADTERRELGGGRLPEALDAPLGGVVEAHRWKGDLAADAGHLDEPSATLAAQVSGGGPGELDRRRQVGRDLAVDLLVGEFFGCSEKRVTGVGHDDVDPVELSERAIDDRSQHFRVGDVQAGAPQLIAVLVRQVVQGLGTSCGGGDPVPSGQQLFGEVAAEARGRAGDEPGASHASSRT
jgi:hypothetical protein